MHHSAGLLKCRERVSILATFTYEIIERGILLVGIEGTILPGDAERLESFINPIKEEHGAEEGPTFITVSFNSNGGNYLEGIELGRLLNRNGYRSLVKAGNRCHSAAAIAFLGGAGLGATGGWYPDRVMEYGARIGFHTFSVNIEGEAPISASVDTGKRLTTALFNYAAALRIEIDFVIETLQTPAMTLLLLQSAKHLRQLQIDLVGYQVPQQINEGKAVIAANYATHWQRPISLDPTTSRTRATVTRLTARDFKRRVMTLLIERFDLWGNRVDDGLIAALRQEIEMGKETAVEKTYSDLVQVDLLPHAHCHDQDIYQIEGFDFGGGFYTMECFVWSEGEPHLIRGITAFLVSTTRNFEVRRFSKKGDIIYELCEPDENVGSTH